MRKLAITFVLFLGMSVALYAQPIATPDAPPVALEERLYTPESSVLFALADLKTLPSNVQPFIRYLSLYNIPKEKRDEYAKCVSFVVNSLSTRRKIYIPEFVGASDKTVIRLNMKNYDWPGKAWEDLALKGSGPRPFPEPYFHTLIVKKADIEFETTTEKKMVKKEFTRQVEKPVQIGVNSQNGKPFYQNKTVDEIYEKEVEVEVEVKTPVKQINKQEVLASAPWINADIVADFISLTQSEAPVLRADWFVINATLPPTYYNFLKLGKSLDDFEKFAFTDLKMAEEARSQDKAVILMSGVTRNNRRVRRSPSFAGSGYYWQSFDVINSTKNNRILEDLLSDKFDATELVASLPNGLQSYFLANGQKVRQDAAPIDIAIDSTSVDRVVRSGRSCMICHAEGVKPIEDEVRALNKWNPQQAGVKLLITKENDSYQIDDLFGSDLDRIVINDQQRFADAVAIATGYKTPIQNAKAYAAIYDQYAEILMTKESVARDLGLTLMELDTFLKNSNDPVMLGLVRQPIRPVRRDQFEESFQRFMLVVMAMRQRPGDPVPRVIVPNDK